MWWAWEIRKEEIIRITTRLLGLEEPLPADAADAAAMQSLMSSEYPAIKIMNNLEHIDSNLSSSKRTLTPNQQVLDTKKISFIQMGSKQK